MSDTKYVFPKTIRFTKSGGMFFSNNSRNSKVHGRSLARMNGRLSTLAGTFFENHPPSTHASLKLVAVCDDPGSFHRLSISMQKLGVSHPKRSVSLRVLSKTLANASDLVGMRTPSVITSKPWEHPRYTTDAAVSPLQSPAIHTLNFEMMEGFVDNLPPNVGCVLYGDRSDLLNDLGNSPVDICIAVDAIGNPEKCVDLFGEVRDSLLRLSAFAASVLKPTGTFLVSYYNGESFGLDVIGTDMLQHYEKQVYLRTEQPSQLRVFVVDETKTPTNPLLKSLDNPLTQWWVDRVALAHKHAFSNLEHFSNEMPVKDQLEYLASMPVPLDVPPTCKMFSTLPNPIYTPVNFPSYEAVRRVGGKNVNRSGYDRLRELYMGCQIPEPWGECFPGMNWAETYIARAATYESGPAPDEVDDDEQMERTLQNVFNDASFPTYEWMKSRGDLSSLTLQRYIAVRDVLLGTYFYSTDRHLAELRSMGCDSWQEYQAARAMKHLDVDAAREHLEGIFERKAMPEVDVIQV